MKKKIILIMLILLAVGIVAEKKPTLVIRSADRKIITEDKLEAYKVEITWDEYIIYADYLEFNKKTNIIRAEGRVTMASKNTVISGDKLKFNIKEKTGEIYETSGRLAPSLSYTTDKLHQVDNETLTFKKFMFTTCTQCNPRWKITCSKGKIKKEKYIEMKNVFFKVKNIPIFYFPYLRYPVNKNGRSTGFLFPKIGTSSLKGFFLLNAFYWSLSEHTDVTFHFDYFSRAGMGVAEEFRYINRKMEGNVKFYFIDYKDSIVFKDGTCPIDKNIFFSRNPADYSLNIQHNQNIDFLNTKIIATVDKQSDDNFKRLFSNDFYTTQKRISRSSVSIQSTLSNLKLSARASQNNTYDTINDRSSTITYLPTLGLNLKNQAMWKLPLYFSLDASYSIIKRVGKSYEEEEEELLQNVQSKRLRIKPSIKMNLLNLRWINAALTIQTTHNYYPQSLALQTQEEEEGEDAEENEVLGEDEEEDEEPEIVDVPLHLHYQSAVLNVKGPVLGRLYMLKHSKIKHLIEPKITLQYVTKVDAQDRDRLIAVDRTDYPAHSTAKFSLTNRLLHKKKNGKKSAKDILSHTISQTFYLEPALASRGRTINGLYPQYSQLTNQLRFKPVKNFDMRARVNYNHYLAKLTRVTFSLKYTDKKSPVIGSFNYTKQINQYQEPDYEHNKETIGGGLEINHPDIPFKLKSGLQYDIKNQIVMDGSLIISVDYQCIIFKGEAKLIRRNDVTETQFNIGVSIGNLGMVKDILGTSDD